jgi:hypothetical protein
MADDDRDNATVTSSAYGEFIYLDDSTVATTEGGWNGGGGGGGGNSSVRSMARRSSLGRSSLASTARRSLTSTASSSATAAAAFSAESNMSDQDDRVIFIDDDSEVLMVDSTTRLTLPVSVSMPMIHEDDEIIFLDNAPNPSPDFGESELTSRGDCELGMVAPVLSNKDPRIDHEDEDHTISDATSATDPVIAPATPRSWFRTEQNSHWFIWEFIQFQKTRSWKKKLLTILVTLSSIYVIVDLIFLGNVQQWINASLRWMTAHPFAASLSFFGLFVVTSLMFVPITPLVFASGFCFVSVCGGSLEIGTVVAIVLSFVSLVVGAVLSFLRARYMSQDIVRLFATRYPIVKAADRALQRKGFKIMLLLRLWYV